MRPPATETELIGRARGLAGLPLGVIAAGQGARVPPDLRGHKGWIGELIERELGAPGVDEGPDFPELGVECKTVPVDDRGAPREATWVCLADPDSADWLSSRAHAKLNRVLFVPIFGVGPPGGRRVGDPVLWTPTSDQEATLRADWEAHVEVLSLGEFWQIDARRGVALQLRPKAARGDDTHWALDDDGEWVRAQPKGFYLRRAFVRDILASVASGASVR